jgi:hypothetical protein
MIAVEPRAGVREQAVDDRGPCVVHLVREANGPEPLREFLDSYRRHEPGLEHRLVLLFKGFSGPDAVEAHRRLARDLPTEEFFVPDDGFDLTAYRRAAEALAARRYCFLNSHSRIQADGWLEHLDHGLAADGVGISGASGSWASILSYALFHLGLPSAYRTVFEGRRDTLRQFQQLNLERMGEPDSTSSRRQLLNTAIALAPLVVGFRSFPAPHVRTNAFAITHDVLVRVLNPNGRSKTEALRLESGRRSVTRAIERMGLRAVLADRHGTLHEPAAWAESEIFWQGEQEGLLVADNQTEQYRVGDAARRRLLSRFAWGAAAH